RRRVSALRSLSGHPWTAHGPQAPARSWPGAALLPLLPGHTLPWLTRTGAPWRALAAHDGACPASPVVWGCALWPHSRNWRKIYGKNIHHVKTMTWQTCNLLAQPDYARFDDYSQQR